MRDLFKADDSAAAAQASAASASADRNEIKWVAPRNGVANGARRLDESSLDLHHGLDVSEAEIDTVSAALLKDLFNL